MQLVSTYLAPSSCNQSLTKHGPFITDIWYQTRIALPDGDWVLDENAWDSSYGNVVPDLLLAGPQVAAFDRHQGAALDGTAQWVNLKNTHTQSRPCL